MTPYRKKLIEVALPLEAINVASAREKSIRHGHPSTLHLWWARRPLAACRAVLFASLVDDPDSDPAYSKYDAETREHLAGEKRQQLFDLITELVQWENSNNELAINAARAEIARCVASRKIELGELKKDHKLAGGETVYDLVVKGHGDLAKLKAGTARLPNAESVNAFLAEHAPPVLDPFCGGGSIPLEAQRLGLRAYASDLNPVPVLITKALIEIPPKFANMPPVNPDSRGEAGPAGKEGKGRGKSVLGKSEWHGAQGLADDVRYYGKWMRDEAEKCIGHLYPKVKITTNMAITRPDLKPYIGAELPVIAWVWARTVASINPAAGGARVPLARTFCLSTKKGNEAWIEPVINTLESCYRFRISTALPASFSDPKEGTVKRTGVKCLLTGSPIPFEHVREEGKHGRLLTQLMAIACEGSNGRVFVDPLEAHEKLALSIHNAPGPDTPIPERALGFRVHRYGMTHHRDLFTARQLTALCTLADLVAECCKVIRIQASTVMSEAAALEYAKSVATYLAFAVDKAADYWSTICFWHNGAAHLKIVNTFSRQAIPMSWDFAEANPFSDSSGNFFRFPDLIAEVLEFSIPAAGFGVVEQRDAVAPPIAESVVFATDPPYYDNIGYADLSDYFYVWLRRSCTHMYPSLFSTLLTPKSQELIATPFRHDGDWGRAAKFFEDGLVQAFANMRKSQQQDYPLPVFYAFKQAESDEAEAEDTTRGVASTGWETMLEGVLAAGFAITATLPMRTELTGNLKKNVAALASSIVLACRPRSNDAPLTTRREFLGALKQELPDALKHLQRGNIAPVDLAQAAIGPGMAVFTRYSKVMEADGSPMKVRQALALINQMLDEVLAEQEGEFDADTRWALAWFEQYGMEDAPYGMAETLSKAKNTAVNALVESGIVHSRAGKVRLLKRDDLPTDWNPATDTRLRHWEIVQYLIRALETGGETAAADLLRKLGGLGEVARDLAYRLYNLCERKKWPQEALAYNSLVIAWPEISKLARSSPRKAETQGEMFDGARA